MNDDIRVAPSSEEDLRKEAVDSLKRKKHFKQSLFTYLVVNALLIVIWAVSDSDSFWPIWVIGGWGIGLAFQAWAAYGGRQEITEGEISSEMSRLRGG